MMPLEAKLKDKKTEQIEWQYFLLLFRNFLVLIIFSLKIIYK